MNTCVYWGWRHIGMCVFNLDQHFVLLEIHMGMSWKFNNYLQLNYLECSEREKEQELRAN